MRAPYPQPETRRRVLSAVRAGALVRGWPADLPPYRTVLRWVRADAGFAAALEQAMARAPKRGAAAWWRGARVTYDRAAVVGPALEAMREGRVKANWPAGLPGHFALWRWAKDDPVLTECLRAARARGRAARAAGMLSQRALTYEKRDAFLEKVRSGVPVGELTRRAFPGPDRETLAGWLRQDGWFAQEYAKAKRLAAQRRKARYIPRRLAPFDPDAADAVIVALSKGVSLPEILRLPGMPNRKALAAWRKAQPEFAGALKVAKRVCLSKRKRARAQTPKIEKRVLDHIFNGGSLHSAGRLKGAPRHETLYVWKRRSPRFAEAVRWAETFRTERLNEQAMELGPGAASRAIETRLGRLRGGNRPKEG